MAYTLAEFNDNSLAVVASMAVNAVDGDIVMWTLGTSALSIGANAGRRAQWSTRVWCSNAEVCLDGGDCRTSIVSRHPKMYLVSLQNCGNWYVSYVF